MSTDFDLARKLSVLALLGGFMPAVAIAQLAPSVPSSAAPSVEAARNSGDSDGIGGRFGGSLEARAQYTDNFYNQPNNEEDVWGLTIAPAVRYVNAVPRFRFAAEATGDFGVFDSVSSEDNYFDGSVGAGANWLPNSRNAFGFGLRYLKQHDQFGTLRTESLPLTVDRELDKWDSVVAELKYVYGALGSKFQFETGILGRSKKYTSNRQGFDPNDPTDFGSTKFLDYDNVAATFTALYLYSPKTAFLVELVPGRTSFQNVYQAPLGEPSDFFDPSNKEQRYRVGARWRAAAKTTADVRIGYFARQFDGEYFEDFSGFDYQLQLGWEPTATDTLNLEFLRASQESYLTGVSFIDNQTFGLDWNHAWSSRFSTRLFTNYVIADFDSSDNPIIPGTPEREDKYWRVTLGAQYRASRWVKLLAGGSFFNRDSNYENVEFDKASMYLGVRLEP